MASKLLSMILREPLLVGAMVIGSGSLWVFFEVVDTVMEGESRELDERIVLGFRNADDPSDPIGPKWVEELMRDLTALGGIGLLVLVSLIATTFLWVLGNPRQAMLLLFAITGGLILSLITKSLFDRPRPDLVPHGSYVYTKSFPSGHAMLATVVYMTLGAVLSEFVRPFRLKVFLLSTAIAVTLAVGLSRVYLGVHWPTDVVAGWALGSTWALGCWSVARLLHVKFRSTSKKGPAIEDEIDLAEASDGSTPASSKQQN